MREAFILSACRTPIGKFRGALSPLAASDLGAVAVGAAVQRAGADPGTVEEVILGNVLTGGAGQAPARQAALKAGLPPSVAAMSINKVCGSGLKAVSLAAQAVRSGDSEIIVAGGMESMSRAGWVLPRTAPALGDRVLVDTLQFDGLTCAHSGRSMGDIADGLAQQAGISRPDQDHYALESHRRAVAATAMGAFRDEIIAVRPPNGTESDVVNHDEGPRSDTTLEKLAALRPAFGKQGTVTPGNASMISDGAAALVIASSQAAERIGVQPLARIVASVTVGTAPEDLFIAPVAAIRNLMAKAGRSLGDVDLFELNEAFAVQVLACLRQLEIKPDHVNVHGGAIALGHPIGASGARVLVSLVHALRHRGQRLGVAALCLGGGNAVAMLVERV
jgi:acetyl-CoA C-acetyltransferase